MLAKLLGYNKTLWDSGKITPESNQYWAELNDDQQHAATILGYTQKCWDSSARSKWITDYRISTICFVLGSIFYLRLSFLTLDWFIYVRDHVPESLLYEDDDEAWSKWAADEEEKRAEILEARYAYHGRHALIYYLAATSFAVQGLVEIYMVRSRANLALLIAGLAGMASAHSDTEKVSEYWSCVSVHLFLLSCTHSNLFLVGCILECLISYLTLAGFTAIWMNYIDIIACFFWLYCALKEVANGFDFSLMRIFGKKASQPTRRRHLFKFL